jgi:hypothetical protein
MTGPERARAALGARQHPARAVACPRCHAAPWTACTSPRGRRLTAGPHPARITAWTRRKEARQP